MLHKQIRIQTHANKQNAHVQIAPGKILIGRQDARCLARARDTRDGVFNLSEHLRVFSLAGETQ